MVKANLQPPCVILAACLNAGLFEERFSEEEVGCWFSSPWWGPARRRTICLVFLVHPKSPLVPGVLDSPVGADVGQVISTLTAPSLGLRLTSHFCQK